MLLELNIRDFAIIDRLSLRLEAGFNVLTGETGAGKSIIIDALGSLRGERVDPTFVRAGSERARVEGVFSIADCRDIIPLLAEYGLWEDDDEQVILTREVSAESGRSVARINGRAVNASVLREVGGRLVDIHGQHEGLSLFNTRTHGDMLDRYGGLVPLRGQVAEKVTELRRVRDELSALRKAAASRAERIEELRFLLEDVGQAKLRPGEEAELLQERTLVQ
ncbi:DNA recombination protein RecN, partial [Kouleothrix aurantiaca]